MAESASHGDVVVLGGYGELGHACVQDLLETTNARVVIAGPSVQKAERAALTFGERARGAYANAADPRTISGVLENASLVLGCSAAEPRAALDRALERRIPFVSLTPLPLERSQAAMIAERAWAAQTQVVLDAGAVPGLAGVVCEYLTRQYASLREIWIATTGAQEPRRPASHGWGDRARDWAGALRSLRVPQRFAFPADVGIRWVRPATTPELADFAETHCVERVRYHELDRAPWTRSLEHALGIQESGVFALVAEAYTETAGAAPEARVRITASDLPKAAAAAAVSIARAIHAGAVPAGLLKPQEALNPGALLDAIAKRGVRVEGRPPAQ